MSESSPTKMGIAEPGQHPSYSTRSTSHTGPTPRQASFPTGNPASISQLAVNTTMSCQAHPHTSNPPRTDTKKMSAIHDKRDTHDHEHDSAYGSVTSPGMSLSTHPSNQQTKPSTSKPLPPTPQIHPRSSTQNPNRPHLPTRSQSHPTITSPSNPHSNTSHRVYDGSLDYSYLQRPGYGYSVTITGNVNYASKPDTRPRSTKLKKIQNSSESSVICPTPEQVFGLSPIDDCGLRSSSFGGSEGGEGGGGAGKTSLSAYERRMAKRDRFTLALMQPGQGSVE